MWRVNAVNQKKTFFSALFISGLLIHSSISAAEVADPFEKVNRAIWSFNDYFDSLVMRPVAKGYKYITPNVVERGVTNVFINIGNVPTAANNLLQGKPAQAGQDVLRFIINLSFGGLGLYDFASDIGMPNHEEDFGQTLGYWGIPQGPYVVLPFLGPSSVRDTFGYAVDMAESPYDVIQDSSDQNTVLGLRLIDIRAGLLHLDNMAPGDEYSFFRDAYMQRRAAQVRDGQPDSSQEDDFLNDDF